MKLTGTDPTCLLAATIAELLLPMFALRHAGDQLESLNTAMTRFWTEPTSSVEMPHELPWTLVSPDVVADMATFHSQLGDYLTQQESPIPLSTIMGWVNVAKHVIDHHQGDPRLKESLRRVYREGQTPPSWWHLPVE